MVTCTTCPRTYLITCMLIQKLIMIMIMIRVEAEKPVHLFNYIHTINTTNKSNYAYYSD